MSSSRRLRGRLALKVVPLLTTLFALAFTNIVAAVDIGSLTWNQANIAALRSLDRAAIFAFITHGHPAPGFTPAEIGGFGWADPAGNGRYRLVLTLSGPCAHFVMIYKRDAQGQATASQTIEGWADLKTGIRDLNGDGKDELIIDKSLVELSCADNVTWPAVYRLERGRYVEASRDFPAYYDDEVLPKLSAALAKYQAKGEPASSQNLWRLIMMRDKILRVLGRDRAAGLHQAYQWMNTDNLYLLFAAAATFKDIGGHEEEAKAARVRYDRALCKRHPAMVKCRNLPKQ